MTPPFENSATERPAERRARPRQRVQLDAMVRGSMLDAQACRIQDFCLGGLFLTWEDPTGPAPASQPGKIARGSAVQILFSTPLGGSEQEFRLWAQVARVVPDGMGVAFLDPDPAALTALQDLASRAQASRLADEPQTPSENSSAGSPPLDKSPADVQGILLACRQVLTQQLPRMIQAVFRETDSRWLAAASEAKTDSEQASYFEAIAALKQQSERIEKEFCASILDQMDHLGRPREPIEQQQDDEAALDLSLVDPGEFEDWLSVTEIISKLESQYHEPLLQIEQRFAQLSHAAVDKEGNPVGPAVLCHAFQDATQGLDLSKAPRQALYKVFKATLITRLPPVYKDLDKVLSKNGVPPPAPRKLSVRRTSSSHGPKPSERGEGNVEPAAGGDLSATEERAEHDRSLPQDAYRAAGEWPERADRGLAAGAPRSQDLESWRQQTDAPSPENAPLSPPPKAVLTALSALQQEASTSRVQGDRGATLKDRVLAMLARHRGSEHTPPQIGRTHTDAIDVVDHLFASILDDPNLAAPAKSCIKQLEIPLAKAALLDESLLLSESHPARQVLNQLERVSYMMAEDGEPVDPEARNRIDHQLQRLATESEQDPDVFSQVLRELTALDQKQDQEYQHNVERVISACEGTQRVAKAKQAVREEIDARLGGKRVASVIPLFLKAGWQAALMLTYLRAGPDSQTWRQHLRVVDQLLLRLGERKAPSEALSLEVPELLQSIEQGLESVSLDPFRQGEILDKLRALLTARRDGTAKQHTPMVVFRPRTGGAAAPAGRNGESLDAPEGVADERWARSLEQARRLQVGDWLAVAQGPEDPQRLRLAWIGEDRSQYVWVNRRGLKVATLNLRELAEQLQQGKVTVLEDLDVPLVDRASQRMLQKMQEQLAHQATHDPLTGLLNRKAFERRLEDALASAKQEQTPHVLCFLDLDQFKVINTTCGYGAGDTLVKDVSTLLQKHNAENAALARLGGDEFGVLLEGCSEKNGYAIAERMRAAIQDFRFVFGNKLLPVGVSIGLVALSEHSQDASSLLTTADSACLAAKDAGRNRILVYRSNDTELARRQALMEWVARINRALDEDYLQLRCHRIAPIGQDVGDKAHYEVLLGVLGENGEPLSPLEFIQAAELYNRMSAVDRWVIHNVFLWMAEHGEALEQLSGLSINLSGHSLNDEHLVEFVKQEFCHTNAPADKVCFEITETVAISNLSTAVHFIDSVRALGCRFSLDDFGSGLSSYSYLKNLPVDYLKIDGMFVKDIVENPNDYAVVKSINEIGHFMGKKTIAEYVENDAIVQRLREIGVDYAQGFGIEKPRLLADIG